MECVPWKKFRMGIEIHSRSHTIIFHAVYCDDWCLVFNFHVFVGDIERYFLFSFVCLLVAVGESVWFAFQIIHVFRFISVWLVHSSGIGITS